MRLPPDQITFQPHAASTNTQTFEAQFPIQSIYLFPTAPSPTSLCDHATSVSHRRIIPTFGLSINMETQPRPNCIAISTRKSTFRTHIDRLAPTHSHRRRVHTALLGQLAPPDIHKPARRAEALAQLPESVSSVDRTRQEAVRKRDGIPSPAAVVLGAT